MYPMAAPVIGNPLAHFDLVRQACGSNNGNATPYGGWLLFNRSRKDFRRPRLPQHRDQSDTTTSRSVLAATSTVASAVFEPTYNGDAKSKQKNAPSSILGASKLAMCVTITACCPRTASTEHVQSAFMKVKRALRPNPGTV